jgi:hypothetical protein
LITIDFAGAASSTVALTPVTPSSKIASQLISRAVDETREPARHFLRRFRKGGPVSRCDKFKEGRHFGTLQPTLQDLWG